MQKEERKEVGERRQPGKKKHDLLTSTIESIAFSAETNNEHAGDQQTAEKPGRRTNEKTQNEKKADTK